MSNQADHAPSVTPSWKQELDSRIKNFSEAIEVSENTVREVFASFGISGENEKSLFMLEDGESLPISDLFEGFVDSGLTKKSLIRYGMKFLLPKSNSDKIDTTISSSIEKLLENNIPKPNLSDLELLKRYDQNDSEITDILRKRSHGRFFLVFNTDRTINIESSFEMLKIAKRQPMSDKHSINGRIQRLYRAGEAPSEVFEESPFFPGVLLQNEFCPKSSTTWKNVTEEARILIRLHVKNVEKAQISQMEMKKLAKLALDLNSLKEELSEAVLIYDSLKEVGKLPSLKTSSNNKSTLDNGF